MATKKEASKKTTSKKVVPITKAKKVEPVKKESRRLTNKERDAVSSALVSFMLMPEFDGASEEGKLLVSALEKIRVK